MELPLGGLSDFCCRRIGTELPLVMQFLSEHDGAHGMWTTERGGPCAVPAECVIGWFRVQHKNNRLASREQSHGPTAVAGVRIAASSENVIVGAMRHSS
jgi:hypothetical protein